VRPRLSSYSPESNVTFETYLNESIIENFVFANISPDIILETAQEKTIFYQTTEGDY